MHNFAPADLTWLNLYLLLFGLFVGPKAVFALCSWVGWGLRKLFRLKLNYGHYVGIGLGFVAVAAYVYGLTVGVGRIRVNHVELIFKDLPAEFDGYRIVHISDLHVGTFDGWRRRILHAEIDSIRAQHADIVCFAGDMQNMRPEEMEAVWGELVRLPKTFFVLGNHDYASYVKSSPVLASEMRHKLLSLERRLGVPLCNDNVRLIRNGASIWLAGEENDGKPPFESHADLRRTLHGIPDTAFVIMLQHDPSAWRRDILPHSRAQLTLSGHTHGGQMQLFGLRPTMLAGKEDLGLYEEHGRYLYVSAGLGGLVPFRLGMPNEITVLTLRKR